ncbi:type II secretion system protein [Clostridium chrysemydis]|uniref:type II secretion system protein n=1 Tax=Clostridium chrysemydis TaxID=2665504 RepID=UPI001883FC09|nr:prepilin-type N-terminal cleavage/methylation domain-containing protein [Clostridium chrysemydis]
MLKNHKDKGFTLIEVIAACFILVLTSSFLVKVVSTDYKHIKFQNALEEEKKNIEIIKNEIKYNISLCDLSNITNKKGELFIDLNDFSENILINKLEDLITNQDKQKRQFKIKLNEKDDTSMNISLEIIEKGDIIYKDDFKKEFWMEKI